MRARQINSGSFSNVRSDRAVVMVEFALVVGFLFFFLISLAVLGRVVTQLIWVNQVSYQATVEGMMAPPLQRSSAIERIVNGSESIPGTLGLHQQRRNNPLTFQTFSSSAYGYTVSASSDGPEDSVWAQLMAQTPYSWFGKASEFLPLKYVGPSLRSKTSFSNSDSLADFGNDLDFPAGNHWGCCVGAAADTSDCFAAWSSPNC